MALEMYFSCFNLRERYGASQNVIKYDGLTEN